jgi:hypothetical protein
MTVLKELFNGVEDRNPIEIAAVTAFVGAGLANALEKSLCGDLYGPLLGVAALTSAYFYEKHRPSVGPIVENARRMLLDGRFKQATDAASGVTDEDSDSVASFE